MRSKMLGFGGLLMALACTGGPADDSAAPPADQDVRGVYALEWTNTFLVRLDIGGAVQETTASEGEVVTFNAPDGSPLVLDLSAWCADEAVTCPSEAWSANVAIDEDNPTVSQAQHVLRAWDADVPGAVVSGWVDHNNDQFVLALGGDSGGNESCGALALSLAGGTFYYPDLAPDSADTASPYAGLMADGVAAAPGGPTGIIEGRVAVGWLGVCAWSGLAVAATLSIETEYTAVRTGDLP